MQRDVGEWLEVLEMEEYKELFKREGFDKEDDLENLKSLNEEELKAMGIVKRG